MPSLAAVESLLTRAVLVGGAAFGVNDAALPPLARVAIPLAASLVLAALVIGEHWTTTAAIHSAAAQGPQAPTIPQGLAVAGTDVAAVMAAVGAALETARTGTVASAPGRHEAQVIPVSTDDTPTAILPAIGAPAATYPPAPPTTLIGA